MKLKLRNISNFAAGWLLVAGDFALVVFADPLGLHTPPPDGGFFEWSIITAVLTYLGAALCYTIFIKPYVHISNETLKIVNPLFTWTLPMAGVQWTIRSQPYPSVVATNGKKIYMVGLERDVASELLGKSPADQLPIHEEEKDGNRADRVSLPRRKPNIISPTLIFISLAWAAYAFAAYRVSH